ncbi:MAG: glycosyltransferase [Bacteroidales bacterium]|jgi:glycosyltransferase involved in cell wall biosynthesis|nr:glycosyltransferase [Bacteroidales bacterium]
MKQKHIKEVTVFTDGDSTQLNVWSNVPYFFTETLISKGIKVNRVDISASQRLENLYYKTFHFLARLINRATTYDYVRCYTHYWLTRKRIKKALARFPDSDVDIFLTFSFSSVGFTHRPIVQFCDWTYAHYLSYFAGRKPDFFEKQAIKREDRQILGSDWVFPLFPSVAELMKKRYGSDKIFYLGNVINSLYDVSDDDIQAKRTAKNILFVGGEKYIDGAISLIEAYRNLKPSCLPLSLHIVGLEKTAFGTLPDGISCYGYLDKAKDNERTLYYKLLREASVFVNTTPKWGAFSASIEAMYFHTPVIVSPYSEFLSTFGKDIGFGAYCSENTAEAIATSIQGVLQSNSYTEYCYASNDAVKEFTWSAYIDKVIAKIESRFPTQYD